VMVRSLDADTRSNYGAGLLRFTQFCDSINIPEAERMPAADTLVAQFAAAFAGTTSDKTLNNWLAGLQFWHVINGASWQSAPLLHHARRGFAKMVPTSSCRTKRPPVTIDALCILFDHLDLTIAFNVAVCTVALVSFWCCCRLGELLIASPNVFDPLKHVSRSIVPIPSITLSNHAQTRASTLHIPWSKTTKEQGADISIMARDHRTCPLTALERHLLINCDIPSHAPLFSFQKGTGWSPMTRPLFLARCNEIWVAQGFPNLPGHVFRIGGTTELLLQGTHPDIVAMQGRWTSDAFLEYWRCIDTILPLFIASTANTQRLLDLDRTMDAF
ncbi:DNA breaking-rejoining enzyme, partial [Suillus paluster]|uniref:DNA breaking-rejoining enzyme n=1 Tax=Suillus paluster TaxID=48578 RepID=UPI001B871137